MKKYFFLFILALVILSGLYLYKAPIPFEELKAKYSNEDSRFIELNDLQVHYKVKGSGFPIILIHGTSSSLHTWEQWETVLSEKYTTYSIDMQGGGLTTPPSDNDYSIEAYIALIDAFVEKLEIDSFYLAGNSLGGHTAWAYAANSKNSSRVQKLILVDPSGFFDKEMKKPIVFQLAQSDFLFNNIEKINTKPFVKKSLKEVFYNDDLVSNDLINRYAELGSRKGNRQAFFYKVRQIEEGEVLDLQKIACPTLIQWGKDDLWIPLKLSEIFTTNILDNELIVYENCGHVPMEEVPLKSVSDVLTFLDK